MGECWSGRERRDTENWKFGGQQAAVK